MPIFNKEELEELSFNLYVCSGGRQYIRNAKAFASKKIILPEFRDTISQRCNELFDQIVISEYRDVPEIELAGLLPILLEILGKNAEPLLRKIASSEAKTASWVRCLAKNLLEELS